VAGRCTKRPCAASYTVVIFALVLVPTLLLSQAPPRAETEREVRTLVLALRSEKAEDRDLATRKLCDLGEAARSELDSATRGEDPEVAGRARFILRVIEIRGRLTRNLLDSFRGLDVELASGDPHEWTTAFLACRVRDAEGRRKHPGLGRSDVEPLAAPALRGARTPLELDAVCSAIAKEGHRTASPELITCLRHRNANVRHAALSALVQTDSRSATPEILKLLGDPDGMVRSAAARALGQWRTVEAVPGCLRLLGDPDRAVRQAASRTLAETRAASSVPALLELVQHGSPDARWEALEALGSMHARDAWHGIVPVLQDPDARLRAAAAKALGELGERDVVNSVLPLLEDQDPEVRAWAACALGKLGAKSSAGRLLSLLQDPKLGNRDPVIVGLEELNAAECIPDLRELLRHREPGVRRDAATALCFLKATSAVPDLVGLLAKEIDRDVRMVVVFTLGRIGRPEAAESLVPLLDSAELRTVVIDALADLGARAAAPRLAGLLRSDDRTTCLSTLYALGRLQYAPAIPAIVAFLEDDDETFRTGAAIALGRLGATAAVRPLEKLLEDLDPSTRQAAAGALATLGSRSGVPVLLESRSSLRSLNALRRPDSCKALACRPTDIWPGNSPISLELIRRATGLPVEVAPSLDAGALSWLFMPWAGVPSRTGLGFLEGISCQDGDLILEGDRIRAVPIEEALAFWRKWWAQEAGGK